MSYKRAVEGHIREPRKALRHLVFSWDNYVIMFVTIFVRYPSVGS